MDFHGEKSMGLMQKVQDLDNKESKESIKNEVEKNLQIIKIITAEAMYRCLKSKKMQQALKDLHELIRKL